MTSLENRGSRVHASRVPLGHRKTGFDRLRQVMVAAPFTRFLLIPSFGWHRTRAPFLVLALA